MKFNSLDIRWVIFGILTIVQFSDCAKHQKTYGLFINENNDKIFDPVTNNEYIDRATTEVDCPLKCSCLGDLADCSRGDFEEIPNIPSWAKKL